MPEDMTACTVSKGAGVGEARNYPISPADELLAPGWRRDLVGLSMLRFLGGEIAVGYDPKKGSPTFHEVSS